MKMKHFILTFLLIAGICLLSLLSLYADTSVFEESKPRELKSVVIVDVANMTFMNMKGPIFSFEDDDTIILLTGVSTPIDDPEDPIDDPEDPDDPDTLEKKVLSFLEKVSDPDKEKTTEAVAKIYRSVLEMAQDEAIRDLESLVKATDMLYKPLMSAIDKLDSWEDFKSSLDTEIEPLSTLSEGIEVWKIISETLEGVSE